MAERVQVWCFQGVGMRWHWVLVALWMPLAASAAVPVDVGAQLSRYAPGQMPVDPTVINALDQFRADGDPGDVALLRSIARHERSEIADFATRAIAGIRSRQRDDQRDVFARDLPDWPELAAAGTAWQKLGLGEEEAACVAYAHLVLGAQPKAIKPQPVSGGAAEYLANGSPRMALLSTVGSTPADGLLKAQAHEDLGDLPGALRTYAVLAAAGVPEARQALDGYGIDVERLMLGLLVSARAGESLMPEVTDSHAEAEVLEMLVRHGGNLTVAVLAERTRNATISEGATAADALARMLDPHFRAEPLPVGVDGEAWRALRLASRSASAPVAEIAQDALAQR